jgi:hypothetical protein
MSNLVGIGLATNNLNNRGQLQSHAIVLDILKVMLNVDILRNLKFIILNLSQFLVFV